MRIRWRHIVIGSVILPVAALTFAWSGLFNVAASTGHWKITDWFLHSVMRASVRTYSLAVDVPPALPHENRQAAAGHFARGCAICHGAPGEARSAAARAMLPPPPDLTAVVGEWNDAELFRIVKHGVRFTGMPAWPAQTRDDEVWAMVAFLRELPELDAASYRALAHSAPPAPVPSSGRFGQALAECGRCHGADGLGYDAATPALAGQSEAYLLASLRAYVEGRRLSGVMQLSALTVDPADLPELARHFANLPPPPPSSAQQTASIRRHGEAIARRGLPVRKVPACLGCHGAKRNPAYPVLEGQKPHYIAAQLRLFRDGKRGGTAFSHLMENAAQHLSDADIAALAAYFSGSPRRTEPDER